MLSKLGVQQGCHDLIYVLRYLTNITISHCSKTLSYINYCHIFPLGSSTIFALFTFAHTSKNAKNVIYIQIF